MNYQMVDNVIFSYTDLLHVNINKNVFNLKVTGSFYFELNFLLYVFIKIFKKDLQELTVSTARENLPTEHR